MKILIRFGLALIVVLLAGYGGVVSIDKTLKEISIKSETPPKVCPFNPDDAEIGVCSEKEMENGELSVFTEDESIVLGGLNFITLMGTGLDEAKRLERPSFIYFRSSACGWCKRFEEDVLTDKEVISLTKNYFVPISIEVNKQRKISRSFNVRGTPTMVFLDGDREIERIMGYVDVESFSATLKNIKSSL
jgi:hypothetical protein